MKIITALDYALSEGVESVHDRILLLRGKISQAKNVKIEILGLDAPRGDVVFARIWQGQWIADCPTCNGAQFVDPNEPIFFCFGCCNRKNGNYVMPVAFPPEGVRQEIEELLLARPVDDFAGVTELERAGLARPIVFTSLTKPDGSSQIVGLSRNWIPSETLEDLRRQNAVVDEWKVQNGL